MDTTNADLYFELLNTVYEVADACDGFSEINVPGIQELCGICFQSPSKYNNDQVFNDSCQTAISILRRVADDSRNPQKVFDLMLILVKIVFQSQAEEVYKNAIWTLAELIQSSDGANITKQFAAALCYTFNFQESELTFEDDDVNQFLSQNVLPYLYQPQDDTDANDDAEVSVPIYEQIAQGKFSFMTQVVAQTIRKIVYCMEDHEDTVIGKLLVGLSRMARQTSFVGTDKQLTLSAIKDIYVYLQSGEKNKGQHQVSAVHKAHYQLSNKKIG